MEHNIAYFKAIQNATGSESLKQTQIHRATMKVDKDFKNTINWERATIGERDVDLLITPGNSDTTKKVKTRPHEPMGLGELIYWSGTYWLVTSLNFDDQIHNAGTMTQCNVVLRWQMGTSEIHQTYGVAEDAARYSNGEKTSQYLITADFQLKVTVPVTEETLQIERDKRFILGTAGTGYRQSPFSVTRVNVITGSYDVLGQEKGKGCLEITMMEDQFREGDNKELGIADYIKEGQAPAVLPSDGDTIEEGGWF